MGGSPRVMAYGGSIFTCIHGGPHGRSKGVPIGGGPHGSWDMGGPHIGRTNIACYYYHDFLLLVSQSGFRGCDGGDGGTGSNGGRTVGRGEAYRAGRPGEGRPAAGPCARRGYFSDRTAIPSGGDAYPLSLGPVGG